MKLLVLVTAAAVAAGTLAATARPAPPRDLSSVKRYDWGSMTLAAKIEAQRQLVAADRRVLATWDSKRWHEQLRRDVNGAAYTVGWIAEVDLDAPPPPWVTIRRAHMRWTTRELGESLRLQRKRATVPLTGDWETATRIADRFYPGSSGWLLSCSKTEGGYGPWVWYGHLPYPKWGSDSTPGGWMQFHQTTFWRYFHRAADELRRRGIVVPAGAASYTSPIGQALAGAYALRNGGTREWTGSGCN